MTVPSDYREECWEENVAFGIVILMFIAVVCIGLTFIGWIAGNWDNITHGFNGIRHLFS